MPLTYPNINFKIKNLLCQYSKEQKINYLEIID